MREIEGDTLLGFGDFFEDGVSDRESGAHGQADAYEIGAVPAVARRVPLKVPPGGRVPARAAVPGKPGAKVIPMRKGGKPGGPKGRIAVRKTKSRGKPSPHKAALANAAKAGQRAMSAAKGGAKRVVKYKQNVAKGKHAPAVRLTKIGFDAIGQVVLGIANPRLAKKMTPKQKAAVQKQVNAAAKLSKANKAVAVSVANAKKKGQAALDFVKKAVPVLKKALVVPARGKTALGAALAYIEQVGGVNALTDEEVMGLSTLLGIDGISGVQTEIGMDGLSGEQTEIGYLDDGYEGQSGQMTEIGQYGPVDLPDAPAGSPEVPYDAYETPSIPGGSMELDPMMTDSGSGIVTDPYGNVIYDPATDQEVIPMPARGQTLTPEELSEIWDHVPEDGFLYASSERAGGQYPPNSVGSANTFLGTEKNANGWAPGYIFGGDHWLYYDSQNPNTFASGTFSSTSEIQGYSKSHGWGPLIGNPNGELRNMQFAEKDKKWFWQGKAAPLAYSAEADSKIAQANQAIIAANRAAAVAQAKQMAADLFTEQEAQARQDAANALAESAAESQMNVAAASQEVQYGQMDIDAQRQQLADQAAQSQAAAQAAQVQAQAQQAMIQQSTQQAGIQEQAQQAMIQQETQQAQMQAQAQQLLIDEASMYNKYAAEHPEEMAAQMLEEEMVAAEPVAAEDETASAEEEAMLEEEMPLDESDFPVDDDNYEEGGAYDDFGDEA